MHFGFVDLGALSLHGYCGSQSFRFRADILLLRCNRSEVSSMEGSLCSCSFILRHESRLDRCKFQCKSQIVYGKG